MPDKLLPLPDNAFAGGAPASAPAPRLLDQVVARLRVKHYSLRTEQAYVSWIKRYIIFHGKRHPADMGKAEVEAFLSSLAVERGVAASTQAQALAACCSSIATYSKTIFPGWTMSCAPNARCPSRRDRSATHTHAPCSGQPQV